MLYFCRMQMKKYILLGLISVLLSSCSEYQKALKSQDAAVKYTMAEKQYQAKKYKKANRLFEVIASEYSGKPQGERVYYMYGKSLYELGQYQLAAYQFERLQKLYPRSEKAAEAGFLEAKSLYNESPKYSVDQTYTYDALEKLQSFLDRYGSSEFAEEANKMTLDLVTRLQKKDFEIAKQYDQIRD